METSRQSPDARSDSFVYRLDADETPSEAVVEAVSSAADCRPAFADDARTSDVLPPLYHTVDPDALDSLFGHTAGGDTGGRVTFPYHGFRVTVRSDGAVVVDPDTEVGDAE